MRKIYLLILVFIGIASILCIVSCSEPKTLPVRSISILEDKTDKFLLKVDIERIINVYELNEKSSEDMGNGGLFRYLPITHVDYAKSIDYRISAVDYEDVNRLVREKEIKSFKNNIRSSLEESQTTYPNLTSSSVFIPITNELLRVKKLSASEKFIIVYSDLSENSNSTFRSYNEYKKGKDAVIEKLSKLKELPDLSGITLVIQFIPKTEQQNELYRVMLESYKSLLEGKGVTVTTEFN